MGEINYDFWDELFEHQNYENINQYTLIALNKCIEDIKNDVLSIQQEFEEIYNLSFQKVIEQKKPKEEICNIACATTATQQNLEEDAKSKKSIKFLEQLKEEITEELEKIDLTKQRMTDNMPSEINDEKNELMKDYKYLQFVEIMHQDEIRRVIAQIKNYYDRYCFTRDKSRCIPMQIEYVMHQINLIRKFLEFEDKVLKFKLKREQMTTKMETVDVEMTNMSCKIDYEKSKLMIDNKYLRFVGTIRQKEINRIFVQLQMYRDIYNMPNEEENIATYRDFIMQRIKIFKLISKLKRIVIDFNLQIEQDATNMETKDAETSNVSSKDDNVKNTLMKNNKCLRYIAMKHQEEINRVYAQLEMFCGEYNKAIEKENIVVHPNVGADDVEKTYMPIDEKDELRKNNEYLRSVRTKYQEEFIRIYAQLQMYSDKYDMPNENVTIVMHMIPNDPMKTHDEENELKRDNEYLAFVAMIHLEKIKEICVSFGMYRNRFDETIEMIVANDDFMKLKLFVTNEIFTINDKMREELGIIKMCDKYITNKNSAH